MGNCPGIIHGPSVSVVATFYNIVDYVVPCVSSLLNQTYPCELVLVNDGSSDGTGEALEKYNGRNNVVVISIPNSGPGGARNAGVHASSGDYIAFVDGDDTINERYIEALIKVQIDTGLQLIACSHQIIPEGAGVAESAEILAEPNAEVGNCSEAIDWLLDETVTESPWAKLASRKLWLQVPFPVGRFYEDVAVAGNLFLKAGGLARIDSRLYNYTMRRGSVVHRKVASPKQADDFLWAINEMLNPIISSYPEKASAVAYRRSLENARLHSVISRVQGDDARMREMDKALRREIQSHLAQIVGNGHQIVKVARLVLLAYLPKLYDVLFSLYEVIKIGPIGLKNNLF